VKQDHVVVNFSVICTMMYCIMYVHRTNSYTNNSTEKTHSSQKRVCS